VALLNLLFLSSLVIGPALLRGLDILVLALLGPAADQNHNSVAIPAKVNAVAGSEVVCGSGRTICEEPAPSSAAAEAAISSRSN
jgi:hypothetical protein